ncbi:MAG: carboxylating nicotinate-nucleotide diphosphorylase [Opitutales bacterium]
MSLSPLDRFSRRVGWADLDPAFLRELIARARAEDLQGAGFLEASSGPRDVTTALLSPRAEGRAHLVARQTMTVCGLPLVPLVAEAYGRGFALHEAVEDGATLAPGEPLGRLEGNVAAMLSAERVLLNLLQHLSGVATETARYVAALGDSTTRLLDTRKTTPGYRALEKYAVASGGGWNHRLGLYDRVMLKDNHLAVAGAAGETLEALTRRARQRWPELVVEVEVDRLDQIPPLLAAGADVIMLDNFNDAELGAALALIAGRAATEASGGITLERLPRLAALGLDFISTGATVHQAPWVDIGLDWEGATS